MIPYFSLRVPMPFLAHALALLLAPCATGAHMPPWHTVANDEDRAMLLRRLQSADGRIARSIAVVGSSGNMLYRGRGKEIDGHDVVIRVNGAETFGYENDVGRDRKQASIVVGWTGAITSPSRTRAAARGRC